LGRTSYIETGREKCCGLRKKSSKTKEGLRKRGSSKELERRSCRGDIAILSRKVGGGRESLENGAGGRKILKSIPNKMWEEGGGNLYKMATFYREGGDFRPRKGKWKGPGRRKKENTFFGRGVSQIKSKYRINKQE